MSNPRISPTIAAGLAVARAASHAPGSNLHANESLDSRLRFLYALALSAEATVENRREVSTLRDSQKFSTLKNGREVSMLRREATDDARRDAARERDRSRNLARVGKMALRGAWLVAVAVLAPTLGTLAGTVVGWLA